MNKSKIFCVLALAAGLLCAGALELGAQTVYSREQAQSSEPSVTLRRDGSKFYLTDSDRPLTEAEIEHIIGEEIYDETVRTAITQFNVGRNLMIAGGSVAAAGFTTALIAALCDTGATHYTQDGGYYGPYEYSTAENIAIAGAVVGVLGFVVLTAGTPIYCVGKGRLNWAVDDYNKWAATQKQPQYSVNFGPQRHGVGLAINF